MWFYTRNVQLCPKLLFVEYNSTYKQFRSRSMLLLYGMANYDGEGRYTASIARKQNIQSHMNTKKPECYSANMSLFECRLSNNNNKISNSYNF